MLDRLDAVRDIQSGELVAHARFKRFGMRRQRCPRAPQIVGRLDEDHTIAGAQAVDRRRRRALEHLCVLDVVRIEEVDVGVLHRHAVNDVERIVVLE